MPLSPRDLCDQLDRLGYAYVYHRHPPLFTVADSQAMRGSIAGFHTKNLFLRDKKDGVFLVAVNEDAQVDLKSIHQKIGASGRVSFGKPELLWELLGVQPGSVTLFGAVNDTAGRVAIIVDEALAAVETVNCHPLTNDATISIAPDALFAFLRSTGHEPRVLKIAD